MPLLNGIEAMLEILKLNHDVKVIFISADESIREKAISKGAIAFLKKPIDINQLQNIIINNNKNKVDAERW